MSYLPNVDDYVKWKQFEGWIYFKCSSYVTIELRVRPKDGENYNACPIHRNERLLLLCYQPQWTELEYVKSRKKQNNVEMVGESIRRESKQM